jgi:hypothetical protein
LLQQFCFAFSECEGQCGTRYAQSEACCGIDLPSLRVIFKYKKLRAVVACFSAKGISRVLPQFYASISHVFFHYFISFIFSFFFPAYIFIFISSVISVFYYCSLSIFPYIILMSSLIGLRKTCAQLTEGWCCLNECLSEYTVCPAGVRRILSGAALGLGLRVSILLGARLYFRTVMCSVVFCTYTQGCRPFLAPWRSTTYQNKLKF